jgi:hypothetical protein
MVDVTCLRSKIATVDQGWGTNVASFQSVVVHE